ncbi:MAG: phosphoglucosamine mutase [Pseudomonadota bacterium]
MSKRRYFGTDGIRGTVGHPPITPDFMLKLGWAVGRVLADRDKVLIGKDTRSSGYMFESALEAGLSAAGVDIYLLGPMPTPAVAYLTKAMRAKAGIVISASHNPFYDNGIKFFNGEGMKLCDDMELAIEEKLTHTLTCTYSDKLGKAFRVDDAVDRYVKFCKSSYPAQLDLKGLKIVIDCANGATYRIAPRVFEELGATIIMIGVEPDGLNINKDCGSQSLDYLAKKVLAHQADLGIAFDGDGDRVKMVNATGECIDGDQLLFIIADYMHQQQQLTGGIVGTVMTNSALEQLFKQRNIDFIRTKVGDRYILNELLARQWQIGGESSGHIIHLAYNTSGDGIISALQVLAAMVSSGCGLTELLSDLKLFPQRLVNIAVKKRADPMQQPAIKEAVLAAEKHLDGRGRILLRSSGTEPLVRIMVEAEDSALASKTVDDLAAVVRDSLC